MISALLLGREGSVGFPGKNLYEILGRPLMEYPLLAAIKAKSVDEVYVSTDSARIKEITARNGAVIIDRPDYLCTKEALGEDAFVHGYHEIVRRAGPQEMLVLLHCNSATVSSNMIDDGVDILRKNPSYDSAVSVSIYNMWSPLRARRINKEGLLDSFVPFETFGDPKKLNCNRDSQGDVYFADMSVSIVRSRCLDNIEAGLLPQKWMGRRIYPLVQEAGCDVDFEFQIAQTEYWLKKHGFTHKQGAVRRSGSANKE
jgi:CMP-N-acetylneuraminic acid synthetase